jgi:hypothetical protein
MDKKRLLRFTVLVVAVAAIASIAYYRECGGGGGPVRAERCPTAPHCVITVTPPTPTDGCHVDPSYPWWKFAPSDDLQWVYANNQSDSYKYEVIFPVNGSPFIRPPSAATTIPVGPPPQIPVNDGLFPYIVPRCGVMPNIGIHVSH